MNLIEKTSKFKNLDWVIVWFLMDLPNELYDKTIGILGYKIGKEIAKRIKPFGTYLIGYTELIERKISI